MTIKDSKFDDCEFIAVFITSEDMALQICSGPWKELW